MVFVHAAVHDLANLVHEDHHLLLQHFGRVHEIPDATKADDGVDLRTWDHRVHAGTSAALHVLADDLSSSLTEAQREKTSEFDNRLFQDDGLHRLLHFLLLALFEVHHELPGLRELLAALRILDFLAAILEVTQVHGLQRVVFDCLHFRNHALDGIQQQRVGIVGKRHGTDANDEADENCLQHAQARLQLRHAPDVESEDHVHEFALVGRPCNGGNPVHLRAAQLVYGAFGSVLCRHSSLRHGNAEVVVAVLVPRLS
mmetsp:Transcript_108712/g.306364  ORF Transcript_108712/g.306364 Transcript_108712/m.306364 type:complete len:257 (+) Transcript_108712:945-1715(+)